MSTIFSQTLGTHEDGWSGYNVRQNIDTSLLTATSATLFRVSLQMFTGTTGGTLDALWIGTGSGAVTIPGFSGDQVRMQFAGSNSLSLGSASTFVSDYVSFPTFDSTKTLEVSMHFAAGGTINGAENTGLGGGASRFYVSGADISGTNNAGNSGGYIAGNGFCVFVNLVEALSPLVRSSGIIVG